MIRKIYHLLKRWISKYISHRMLKAETNKIKDKRRQKILSQYVLSEEQKKQIDKLFVSTYGKKVPYDWHRYYASYTGNFDARFIPELIYIPVIEKKFNDERYAWVMSDKNLLAYFVGDSGKVRTPKVYLTCSNGYIRNSENKIVDKKEAIEILNNKKCFGKPTVDSCSGNMCAVYNFNDGIDQKTGKSICEIIDLMGRDFAFQEIISNCDSVKKIHPQSLNTFRITTYLWNNKVYHFPVIMRIGKGESVLDNAHQGGMFIGITDSGNMCDCAFTEFQDRFYVHPDSGVEYKGYTVPETTRVIEAVENVHQKIPQIGMISWDVVVNDNDEVIIIEMNIRGQSVWLSQMAHGVGAFGENTEEVLKWISK